MSIIHIGWKDYNVSVSISGEWIDGISIVRNPVNPPLLISSSLETEIYRQISSYFSGTNRSFCLPLQMNKLTLFQQKVFSQLINVPYGKTISYEELAVLSGGVNYRRAVGMALSANPFPIAIPCHRVVPKHFSKSAVGGFSCGADVKIALLTLEKMDLFRA